MKYYITIFVKFKLPDNTIEGGKICTICTKPLTNEAYNELIIYYQRCIEESIKKKIKDIEPITEEEYKEINGEELYVNVDLVRG